MAINEKMKWPTDKTKYDKNYLRLWGKLCPICNGKRHIWVEISGVKQYKVPCFNCDSIGWVEKSK